MRTRNAAAVIAVFVALGNSFSPAQATFHLRGQLRSATPQFLNSNSIFRRERQGGLLDVTAGPYAGARSQKSGKLRAVDATAEEFRENGRADRAPGAATIPYWTDSFIHQGSEYKYSMVGSDPQNGSQTTVIPTMIIPFRFVFPDGTVYDASTDITDGGQTAVNGLINSPIFQNYNYVIGGTSVGNTQFADAFQRANFWDSVSTSSPNFHVLLGQPTVAPTQTIDVPATQATYYMDPITNQLEPVVREKYLRKITDKALTQAGATPDMLPIILWGRVTGVYAGGFHGSHSIKGKPQTFISAAFGGPVIDSYIMSHEVLEWLDDPFLDNVTAGWNIPFISPVNVCDSSGITNDLLEVADPVESFIPEAVVPLNTSPFTYHVTEAMFIDFFTRSNPSRSVNGQYSMFTIGTQFGMPSVPSSECTSGIRGTKP